VVIEPSISIECNSVKRKVVKRKSRVRWCGESALRLSASARSLRHLCLHLDPITNGTRLPVKRDDSSKVS
jgi:hypothetical protein